MADHIKVLRELEGYLLNKKQRQALSHAIKCCEIVEGLPSVDELFNYLPSGEIGTRRTARAIHDRIKGKGNYVSP